jgi:hypothetical protein
VYFSFSQSYLADRSAAKRTFLDVLARRLFPNPLVEVDGSSDVDVAVNRVGQRLSINLVNTAGPHADRQSPIHDSLPPVGPLTITIRMDQKPGRVTLEPGGTEMVFEHQNGQVKVTLSKLDIHNVVVIE